MLLIDKQGEGGEITIKSGETGSYQLLLWRVAGAKKGLIRIGGNGKKRIETLNTVNSFARFCF